MTPREIAARVDASTFVLDLDSVIDSGELPRLPRHLGRLLGHLHAVARGGLIVASGRGFSEWPLKLRQVPALLVGEHGWEERRPDGWTVHHRLPPRTALRLDAALRAAESRGWSKHLLKRRASVRLSSGDPGDETAPARAELCRTLWSPAFEVEGLAVHQDQAGVELRAIDRSPMRLAHEAACGGTVVHFGCRTGASEATGALDIRFPHADQVWDFVRGFLARAPRLDMKRA
jgi:hypothetical protein